MRNTKECVLKLQRGKATIVCPFTRGNLQSREPVPASFSTSNEVIQGVLETSPMFASGKIFIISEDQDVAPVVVETPKPTKAAKPSKAPKAETAPKTARVMEDVRTLGDAVTVLMTENGVVGSDLIDIPSITRKAKELGISFPNLK